MIRYRPYTLVALAVLVGGSVVSWARMAPDEARLVPYAGHLMANGAAASGAYDLRFGLFPTEGANADCLLGTPTSCDAWGEEQLGVEVSAGRFAVSLGGSNAITDAVLAENNLWLAIAVRGPSDDAYALLPEKQELLPVPWASRAAAAADYKITGALTVGNGADITGDVNVEGSLVVDRAVSFPCLSCGSSSVLEGNANYGNMTIQGRVVSADANLHLSPPGGSNVIIRDDFRAAGGAMSGAGAGLTVQGNVLVGGLLQAGHLLHTCPNSDPLGNAYGTADCSCPAGYRVLSGGARCREEQLYESRPISTTTWRASCATAGLNREFPKWVQNMTLICARITN